MFYVYTDLIAVTFAQLPGACTILSDFAFSTVNPTGFYEANAELGNVVPPQRIGSWRNGAAIPTQHFAINQCKPGATPMRLMPYSGI